MYEKIYPVSASTTSCAACLTPKTLISRPQEMQYKKNCSSDEPICKSVTTVTALQCRASYLRGPGVTEVVCVQT